MSTTINYIPTGDADRLIWFGNFQSKISIYAVSVGITAAEVTSVQKDYAMFLYIMNILEIYKQTVNNLVAYKSLLKHAVNQQHLGAIPTLPALGTAPAAVTEGVFDRVSLLAKRIKASINYTDAMGQDLGIIAPVVHVDLNNLQPLLTITLDAGRPHIKCNKGVTDGIDLYVDRNDGAGFLLLGRLLKLDYIDVANLPSTTPIAEWDYKAIYVIGNDNVGLMSAVASVLVKKL
ncbi:MAG: hypothetical protein ABI388_09345 [Bacteroidia bacterium]